MIQRRETQAACTLVLAWGAAVMAAPRDVQIRTINFDNGTIELHNFGASSQALDGWQFCTFDEDNFFQYTGSTGMNGLSIGAGGSLFIHTFNDAPALPNRINRSTLGGFFATPLGATAYAMTLYGAGFGFVTPARVVDHVMWNTGGAPGLNAGRASVAVSAGLWTATTDWASTGANTARLELNDVGGGLLHGPADYDAIDRINNPIPTAIAPGAVHLRLETVVTGLTAPNWGASVPSQPGRLFVTDQNGTLWAVNLNTGSKSVYLDVSASLVTLGIFGPGSFDERGLLGVAFHPNFDSNGLLYTYTSQPVSGAADFSTIPMGESANHQAVITEWHVPSPTNPASVVDPGSATVLLRVDEPQFNHNAGAVNFGPDGMLYVSFGDGGGADDLDDQDFFGGPMIGHGPTGNGQDSSTILGTIIRIDPLGANSANGAYGIPADNPLVGVGGAVEEIFAYGFRNPFRFSFDSLTGDLLVGDVGQNHIEEIDVVTSGGNYGWNIKEGTFLFDANDIANGFVVADSPGAPAGLLDPIAQYDHDEGLAILGGFVYRGSKIPALQGAYVFGDFARSFSNDGRLFYLDGSNIIVEFVLLGQPALNLSLLGFGQDARGEIYALANATGVPFGTGGVVLRLATLPGDSDADGDVDLTDHAAFFNCLGGPTVAAPGACASADLDMNGTVDLKDFGLFQAEFTGAL